MFPREFVQKRWDESKKKKGMTGEGEGKDAGYNENALQNSDSQFRKRRIALVSVVVWAEEKRNL